MTTELNIIYLQIYNCEHAAMRIKANVFKRKHVATGIKAIIVKICCIRIKV